MVENDAIRPRDGLLAMQAPDGSYTGECGRMTIHSHPDLTGRRAWLCSAPAVTLLLLLLAACAAPIRLNAVPRSEEHTSELQSLMRISYAVFCLKKKKQHN